MCIYLFNNGGEPHMEGFKQNKRFLKILLIIIAVNLALALNISDDLNYYFELKVDGFNKDA